MYIDKLQPPPFPFPDYNYVWEVSVMTSKTIYQETPGGAERIRYDFRDILLQNISLYSKLAELHTDTETRTKQAAREIIDNIYEHGYNKEDNKTITMIFFLSIKDDDKKYIEIWFLDTGKEFNESDRLRAKNIFTPASEEDLRGLGLKHSDLLVSDHRACPRGYYQKHHFNVQKIRLTEKSS